MTTAMRSERDLSDSSPTWHGPLLPTIVDDVLARTGRMRQRPAWTLPERWLPMDISTTSPPRRSMLPWRHSAVVVSSRFFSQRSSRPTRKRDRRVPAPFGPAANPMPRPSSVAREILQDNDRLGIDRVIRRAGQVEVVHVGRDATDAVGDKPNRNATAFEVEGRTWIVEAIDLVDAMLIDTLVERSSEQGRGSPT